jgi:hypothetical protein
MSIKIELNPIDILLQACNKLYPDIDIIIALDSELAERTKGGIAEVQKQEPPVIIIDSRAPLTVILEMIVHELGHIVIGESEPLCEEEAGHSEEWKETVRSIQIEFLRIQGEGMKGSKIFTVREPNYSQMN